MYVERAGPVAGERVATSPELEYSRADRNFRSERLFNAFGGNSYSYEEESPPVDVLHRPSLSWQVDYFIQTQHVIGDTSFHCRSYAQRLMTAVAATAKQQAAQIQKSERTA